MQTPTLRIGTRPSPLAKVQARSVAEALRKKISADELQIQIVEIKTKDDQMSRSTASTQSTPLAVKSIDFTGALDQALLNNEIDAAVHSLKDIPPTARWCDGLDIVCCLPREDPMDVLVSLDGYSSLRDLPPNRTRVGTSSVRRQAQILSLRDDLELINLRGNVEARLDALRDGKVDALILASAGLNRLIHSNHANVHDFNDLKWHNIPSEEMLSGACQGIIGISTRASDTTTSDWLSKINDADASITAAAERAFLDVLDSFRPSTYSNTDMEWTGRPPLAALMAKNRNEDNSWTFQGMLARPDGSKVLRSIMNAPTCISMNEGRELGMACAKHLLENAGPEFYK
jgi:hydroxymethylbilane synthase